MIDDLSIDVTNGSLMHRFTNWHMDRSMDKSSIIDCQMDQSPKETPSPLAVCTRS